MRILISLAAGAALCSALAPNVLVNQQEHAALYGAHNKADYTGKVGQGAADTYFHTTSRYFMSVSAIRVYHQFV